MSFNKKTREVNKQTQPPLLEKKYPETEEAASGTCFSTDQESQFKSKNKIKNFIQKKFDTPSTKFGDLKERMIWGLVIISSFITIVFAGHFYCSLFVLFVIGMIFFELIDLNKYRERNIETKGYHFVAWYFFILSMYFFNFKTYQKRLVKVPYLSVVLDLLISKHHFICFLLYCFGILIFLNFLTKGYYRYQFRSFAYVQMTALIFSVTCSLIISNIFSGMIWFLAPSLGVTINDVTAYIWGRLFGRTKLTELSPKKTVEGFIGAFISTVILMMLLTNMIISSPSMSSILCPVNSISLSLFEFESCDISKFTETQFNIMGYDLPAIQVDTISIALFVSILAPLGGFFASGYKRAIKIKDFSDTIPGHGGFTDRMDCQVLSGIFTSVWLTNFVFADLTKLKIVMNIIDKLSSSDKMQILQHLQNSIGN